MQPWLLIPFHGVGFSPGTISMGHMVGRPGNKSSGSHGVNVTGEIVAPDV